MVVLNFLFLKIFWSFHYAIKKKEDFNQFGSD